VNDRICAVVVAYNPDESAFREVLDKVSPQVGFTYIINNGDPLDLKGEALRVVQQPDNMGIAHAHNVGIRLARENGYDYVLLLDQDSSPLPDTRNP